MSILDNFFSLFSHDIGIDLGIITAFYLISCYVEGELVKRLTTIGLVSGAVVALWGLPSHFGYDPTCLLFRGTLDVSCWTESFQPKLRIFSTFGQPNWLAAYVAILLSIMVGKIMQLVHDTKVLNVVTKKMGIEFKQNASLQMLLIYGIFSIILYLDLIYTASQSGYLGFIGGLLAFALPFVWPKNFGIGHINKKNQYVRTLLGMVVGFGIIAFVIGQPIHSLNKFTLPEISKSINKQPVKQTQPETPFAGELGGTDSGTIRKIVWTGALDIWRHYPLFGTGVETYAFSYYKFRPVSHNMTSEWDFLYNKAHNEYLNYLATTGTFGLASYILMIGMFLWISIKTIFKSEFLISKQILNSKPQLGQLEIRSIRNLCVGLIAAYISLLVSNFFGFSVVVINIFFYLIPAFVLLALGRIPFDSSYHWRVPTTSKMGVFRWISLALVGLVALYALLFLVRSWVADTRYAKGYNLDRAGEYQLAYPELRSAVLARYSEPTFQDEYSFNVAVLAVALGSDKQSTSSALLAQEAEKISDYVVSSHPNNVVFWKTRVRMFYALSQIDKRYLQKALDAIQKAANLAPTDAKVMYNLGVLYGQTGQVKNAIETLEKTVALKPDYVDARYGLGLYYREAAVDTKGRVVDEAMNQKAIDTLTFVVDHFPKDQAQKSKEALQSWGILPKE